MKTDIYQELAEYNRFQKSVGLKQMTLEEYLLYKKGKRNVKTRSVANPLTAKSLQRSGNSAPSSAGVGNGFAKPANTYTGSRLIGIATMHKSNMVPVFSKDDAVEISRMRRG